MKMEHRTSHFPTSFWEIICQVDTVSFVIRCRYPRTITTNGPIVLYRRQHNTPRYFTHLLTWCPPRGPSTWSPNWDSQRFAPGGENWIWLPMPWCPGRCSPDVTCHYAGQCKPEHWGKRREVRSLVRTRAQNWSVWGGSYSPCCQKWGPAAGSL